MNIAITTTGATLDSTVCPEFASTPFLLIVNAESLACTPIAHASGPGSDQDLARLVLEHDCEAVITGKLSEEAFRILADRHVTRYASRDMSAREALLAMERRELELIRNASGSAACSGDHRGGLQELYCDGTHAH
jgi:predicted Fe-Mo cluster-binding NifX family protein